MNIGGNSKEQLVSIVQRIEKLETEKKVISDTISDVFTEAKGNGFDVKALKIVLKERKMDAASREELESIADTYRMHLGILPLFEKADKE